MLRCTKNVGGRGNPFSAIGANAFRTTNSQSRSAMRGAEFHGNTRRDGQPAYPVKPIPRPYKCNVMKRSVRLIHSRAQTQNLKSRVPLRSFRVDPRGFIFRIDKGSQGGVLYSGTFNQNCRICCFTSYM